MNKRLLALTLVIILMLTLLPACAKDVQDEAARDTTSTKTNSTESDVAFVTIDVIPAAIINEEAQFKLIAEKLSTWKHEDFDTSDTPQAFKYAVTDLDNNGRLEIFSSVCTEEKHSTSTFGYEVNEDITDIVDCIFQIISDPDSYPDYIVDSTDCYINPTTMERFYTYYNSFILGGEEKLLTKGYFFLKDGLMDDRRLIIKTTKSDGSYSYRDFDDFTLTEEKFNSYIDNYYAGYAKCTATFGWIDFANADGVTAADLSQDDLVNSLKASFAMFSVK